MTTIPSFTLTDPRSPQLVKLQSEEMDCLHTEVGKSLSIWMSVEIQLNQTFQIALGQGGGDPTSTILQHASTSLLQAAINFNAKLGMVNAVVLERLRLCPNGDLSSKWSSVHSKTGKLARKRNKIAHRQCVIVGGPVLNRPRYKGDVGVRLIDPFQS